MSEEKKAEAPKEKKPQAKGGNAGVPSPKQHLAREEKKSKWTIERCIKFAKRFSSEQEWKDGAPSSFKSAMSRGWMNDCKKHFRPAVSKTARKDHKKAS